MHINFGKIRLERKLDPEATWHLLTSLSYCAQSALVKTPT